MRKAQIWYFATGSLILFLSLFVADLSAQSEADYVRALATHLGGAREVTVPSGRADIVTDDYAIEVEWAYKWKNSIGQALWYGLQTNRSAGVILIMKDNGDFKYVQQLQSALDHGGLGNTIRVWVYPIDFPTVQLKDAKAAPQSLMATPEETGSGQYWLTTNSNKRHRSSCRWFRNSKGRLCTSAEGVAAQCCH